jgi:hypothetical protein
MAIGVCIPLRDMSVCRVRALIRHELTHLRYFYEKIIQVRQADAQATADDYATVIHQGFDRQEFERQGYLAQCEQMAAQACISRTVRELAVRHCVANRIGLSTLPGNVDTITKAWEKFIGKSQ